MYMCVYIPALIFLSDSVTSWELPRASQILNESIDAIFELCQFLKSKITDCGDMVCIKSTLSDKNILQRGLVKDQINAAVAILCSLLTLHADLIYKTPIINFNP